MLEQLKILLGIADTSKDALLTLLINQAIDEVVNYTHNIRCVEFVESTIVQMAVIKFNRLSSEGLQSEGYQNSQYVYLSDYPETIYNSLKPYRKLRTL